MSELFSEEQLFKLYNMASTEGLFGGNVVQRLIREIVGYREKLKELVNIKDNNQLHHELEKVKCRLSR